MVYTRETSSTPSLPPPRPDRGNSESRLVSGRLEHGLVTAPPHVRVEDRPVGSRDVHVHTRECMNFSFLHQCPVLEGSK